MAEEKKIENTSMILSLMDGNATGRIKCCSTSKILGLIAYKIPKMEVGKCEDDEFQKSGIYFLFNPDVEDNDKQTVYVGQAEKRSNKNGLLARMRESHGTKKNNKIDQWTEGVMLTTETDSLTADELNYLENSFYRIVKEAGRYKLLNGNEPHTGNVHDKKSLDTMIEYAKIFMGALGYNKVFLPVISSKTQDLKHILYMSGKDYNATGKWENEEFVVFRGSKIKKETSSSCKNNILNKRKKFFDENGGNNELKSDMTFRSPSGAASFVSGMSINGWDCWKDENKCSLNDISEQT